MSIVVNNRRDVIGGREATPKAVNPVIQRCDTGHMIDSQPVFSFLRHHRHHHNDRVAELHLN
jgi:hypothetical protein